MHQLDPVISRYETVTGNIRIRISDKIGKSGIIRRRHLAVIGKIHIEKLSLVNIKEVRYGIYLDILVPDRAMVGIKVDVTGCEPVLQVPCHHLEAVVQVYFEHIAFILHFERVPHVLQYFLSYLDGLRLDDDVAFNDRKYYRVICKFYPVTVGKILLHPEENPGALVITVELHACAELHVFPGLVKARPGIAVHFRSVLPEHIVCGRGPAARDRLPDRSPLGQVLFYGHLAFHRIIGRL